MFLYAAYQSFRKLGDVVTSLMSLGYHETFGSAEQVPPFLINVRRAALCRAYSADKNWAIFLGRPPRLPKRYYNIYAAISGCDSMRDELGNGTPYEVWCWDGAIDEMSTWAETRWTSICALLKEDILELFRDQSRYDCEVKAAYATTKSLLRYSLCMLTDLKSDLQRRADECWNALPNAFRMQQSLKDCQNGPWERDFLVSTRLNYLHVQFLLHLLRMGSKTEPSADFITLSCEILARVAEVIVLRHQLVSSSGTSFEWKVRNAYQNTVQLVIANLGTQLAHYGLPAIGILLIAMLGRHDSISSAQEFDAICDLMIVVKSVDLGTVVHPTEPGYALLARATDTIQSVITRVQGRTRGGTPTTAPSDTGQLPLHFTTQSQLEPWNFEVSFWEDLAGYSAL